MASFAVHELVHAVFFKLLAPAGAHVTFGANRETAMIYACAEGVVYSRGGTWRFAWRRRLL